jgi:hypothetical protein
MDVETRLKGAGNDRVGKIAHSTNNVQRSGYQGLPHMAAN